jgi:hypothetical protein
MDKARDSAYSDFGTVCEPKEAGMREIKTSWVTEADHLISRWSEAEDVQAPYNPPWMRDAANTAAYREDVSPLVLELNFLSRLSPFGRGWFERALEGLISPRTCRH